MNHLYNTRLATYREMKSHQWNRICPNCGKKDFSSYINTITGQPIDEKRCGKCNRETHCGYHLPPREWYEEHRPKRREWLPKEQWLAEKRQREREAREIQRQLAEREAERKAKAFDPLSDKQHPEVQAYLNCMGELCKRSLTHTHTLAQWFFTNFSREKVDYALKRYRVGATKDGHTVFWQTDLHHRIRTGKVMAYGNDGHRLKGVTGAINWVHSLLGMEQKASQCLFGEHLLGGNVYPLPADDIALVESEKTAIIMSILMPQKTWLATGGKQNFKHDVLLPLCELDVAVYPDADALDKWEEKIEMLNREYGYRFYIPNNYRDMCTPEARERKWDLADIMIEN